MRTEGRVRAVTAVSGTEEPGGIVIHMKTCLRCCVVKFACSVGHVCAHEFTW